MSTSRLYHLFITPVGVLFAVVFIILSLLPRILHAAENAAYAHYQVAVNPSLSEMQVRLCFADAVADSLTTESQIAHRALKSLHINDIAISRRNQTRNKIYLTEMAPHQCLQYRVDLNIAGTEVRFPKVSHHSPEDILLKVSSWLWLPEVDTRDKRITLNIRLPEGTDISAPWQLIQARGNQHRFELGPSPQGNDSLVAIGRFTILEIPVARATLRLSILGSLPANQRDKIQRWIAHGAASIINVYGYFPLPSAQILVVPIGKFNEPVPWGQVTRGGGSSMQLFIDASRPYEQFRNDWTLVHEFAHFLHPSMDMGSSWLAEGLASYYQNIAQARAGTLTEARAWQKLHEGFQRGLRQTQSGRSLDVESRNMRKTHRYMRVYWSGAAIALIADVELRQQGHSLDQVLALFQQCCLLEQRYWSTAEFMNKLDSLANTSVFSELHNKYVYSDQFPNLRDVYKRLGLKVKGSELLFDDNAHTGRLRRNIMANR